MSLPPISHLTRNELPIPRKCFYYKFSTTTAKKVLSPILSVNLKKLKPGATLAKACEVMSPVPPPSLNHSKFSISRLSPTFAGFPTLPVPVKKSGNKYLKRKYIDYLDLDKKSEFTIHFDRPIRDYFQETVEIRDQNLKAGSKLEIVDSSPSPTQAVYKEQKYLKPKYSSVVMPLPREAEQQVVKELRRQKEKRDKKEVNIKKKKTGESDFKGIHQSLQTDTNSFEFDEWEFDYDG